MSEQGIYTIEELDERCKARPEWYREAVLSRSTQLPDGRYRLPPEGKAEVSLLMRMRQDGPQSCPVRKQRASELEFIVLGRMWELAMEHGLDVREQREPLPHIYPELPPQINHGPGTELRDLLIERGYATPIKGCGCQPMINRMDWWGPDGCEQNMDRIVNHLIQQRHALAKSVRGYVVKAFLTLAPKEARRALAGPHVEALVREAIERSKHHDGREAAA